MSSPRGPTRPTARASSPTAGKKCYEGIGRCQHPSQPPACRRRGRRPQGADGGRGQVPPRALLLHAGDLLQRRAADPRRACLCARFAAPRSREEVVRAILDDLNDIIDRELLDWQWTKAADQGRATRGAAMALKARLLLFEASKLVNPSNDAAKWQAAADAAKAVIEKEAQAGYDLFGDYRKLFLPANEHSCECVFNIEFSKTKNTAVNSFNVYSVQYRNNAPLLDLVMDYRTATDGAAANWAGRLD